MSENLLAHESSPYLLQHKDNPVHWRAWGPAALEEARRNGAQLPVAALVDQFYADVQAMGGNRWDTSSLIARLERTGRG